MRGLLWGALFVAGGALAGAFSAYLVIQSAGVAPVTAGSPWLSRAAGIAGTWGYYVRSHYLIAGRLPPAPGQLMEATAETASDGTALTTSCRYLLSATEPLPRWWSIAAAESGDGGNSRQATADSDTVVRESDGTVKIVASLKPQPGNWLKAPDARHFTLLYSAIPAGGQRQAAPPPFTIVKEGC